MFRNQYDELNKQVTPNENLLRDTINQANRYERKGGIKICLLRKSTIALAATCLCLALSIPVLASTVEPIYQLMYKVSPTIAQFFVPVQKSDEDNGIKMEVVSTYIHDNIAKVYIEVQDLTGQRIDETTDLFDSYSINRTFDSSARCERIGYDKDTKTATFLITIEGWDKKDIVGDKITFTVRQFLSHKKTYNDIQIPIDFSSVTVEPKTQRFSNITGGGGIHYNQYVDSQESILALVPKEPMSEFIVDGIDLTGIGYIDGKLHIQTAVKDNLDKDNHGYFYLKDSNDNRIDSIYTFSFINQYEHPGRTDYNNYVFDIPQSEISNYTLQGSFVTSGMLTNGNWKVTFPLVNQINVN